jgi:hypothetical protein
MRRAATLFLVAAALVLLACRFVQVDLAAFARDEPQFLDAARAQVETGHWLAANPLFGNLGARYGPTAFWFYGVVVLLFGDDPRTGIVAMGLVVTAAYLAFAAAVTRLFEEGAFFFAMLLAWMASSPYHFHWSRLAWDLTSLAGVFGAAALLCGFRELRPGRAVALGAVLGLALSTHPSVTPLVVAVAVALLLEVRAGRLSPRPATLVALSALAVNLPYLLYLAFRARILERMPGRPFSFEGLGALVLDAPRLATAWGLQYFFEGSWADFQAWRGGLAFPLDTLAVISLALCGLASVLGIALALRSADPRQRRMGLIATLSWCGSIALIAVLRLERHPHYQFASAWVPIFGVASCLAWLRRCRPRAAPVAMIALGVLALGQLAVVAQWMGYVRAHGGTRSPAYGSSLAQQEDAMRSVCSSPARVIVLRNETGMFRFPFEYLATTEPACVGRRVTVCAPTPGLFGQECESPPPGTAVVRLRYASHTGGGLLVDH